MGGETCQLNSPRSDCSTAQLEMAKFHWSYLNKDYYPDVIDAFQADNCYTDIQKNLGYRFLLTTATFPQSVALGTPLSVTIKLKNVGYAAPFNKRKAYVVLKNTTTNQIYPLAMASDPRTWLGTAELAITENLVLPANLTTGNYKLYLSLPDNAPSLAARPEYAIRFANESVWESYTGYNSLNYTLNITNAILGVANNEKLNLTIYPMPANDQITVELDRIEDYTVSMYNSLGQTISMKNAVTESNKMTLATSSLSDGLYFIEFAKGAQKDVRKIFIKH